MYVILVYDINKKRVSKVMKTCKKYLHHVQNSVFEGNITLSKLEHLKKELNKLINPKYDSIRIYELDSLKFARMEEIGKTGQISEIIL